MAVLRLITSLVLGRRLHRQVGRLLALEDAIDVAGRLPVLIDVISPIGDQAAGGDEGSVEVDRGQFVSGRQRDDQVAMTGRQRARRHDQSAIAGAREGRDGALDLAGVAHVDWAYLHPERRRHGLDGGKLTGSGAGARVGSRRTATRVTFGAICLSSSSLFPLMLYSDSHETGDVAAWSRQAVDEAGADRIADDREHDRHGAGRLQQRPHGRAAMGQDDVRRERGQFRRVSANFGGIGRGPADVDPHVAADGPAQLLQPLMERREAGLKFRIVRGCGQEYADASHTLGLLRARRRAARDAAPPRTPRNSRRLMLAPGSGRSIVSAQTRYFDRG